MNALTADESTHPLSVERQQAILSLIESGQSAGIAGLAKRFNVSQQTVRRDIKALEEAGQVRRVHGGAVPMRMADLTARRPVTERLDLGRSAKIQAAKAALTLFEDHMSVFIGASSTTLLLAEELIQSGPRLSVMTNMIDIATRMAAVSRFNVTLTGGMVNAETRALTGPDYRHAISHRVFDLAVCGISGISAEHGFLSHSRHQRESNELLHNHAHKLVYVADSSKFGRLDEYVAAPLDRAYCIATDQEPPALYTNALHEANVRVVLPA